MASEQFALKALDFVNGFGLVGQKILEIGCGDGFFLLSMQNAGALCFGIEPSSDQRKLARDRGFKVEEGFLSGNRILDDAPFDAFVTRQVFEHVKDMRDFLMAIRRNIRVGAVGLVEVPNLDKLVSEARFFDFIPEHVNYFLPATLRIAVQLAGFEVLEVCPVQDGEALRALVRLPESTDCRSLPLRVESLRSEVAVFLSRCKALKKKVALWGAGGKGLSMMAVADVSQIQLLVDSDPGKAGLYTPVSHLRVCPTTELAVQDIDVVIILAPAYEREIARTLRVDLGFSGQIVLAGSNFVVIEANDLLP